jgi:hypothetical protein
VPHCPERRKGCVPERGALPRQPDETRLWLRSRSPRRCCTVTDTRTISGLMTGEGCLSDPHPPPLDPAKAFSRSGRGRIFPLFWEVMREWLSTGSVARRPGSVLSESIFSGPVDRADLVNSR